MAHPQNRNDTPELRLRCLTECPPRHGTYPESAVMDSIVALTASVTDRSSGDTDLYSTLICAREGADSWSVSGERLVLPWRGP